MTDPVQMPPPMRLFFVYFWVLGLAVTAFNYLRARRALNAASLSPERLAEGQRYLRVFVVMSAIPLGVMAVGQQLGRTPTLLHYFRPQDGNPFVLAWLAVTFAQACFQAWWVLLAGGLAKLEELDLLSAFGFGSAPTWVVKLMSGAAPFFILLWAGILSRMNVPIPS